MPIVGFSGMRCACGTKAEIFERKYRMIPTLPGPFPPAISPTFSILRACCPTSTGFSIGYSRIQTWSLHESDRYCDAETDRSRSSRYDDSAECPVDGIGRYRRYSPG